MSDGGSCTRTNRRSVAIEAPARIHLGFMDLNGDLGRKFGSVGLTLEGISTQLRVEPADEFDAEGPDAARALRCAKSLYRQLDLQGAVRLRVNSAIPAHEGFGSGTQLALAVGAAVDRLYGLGLGMPRVAQLLNRGARSGIGIGAFDQGGFLIDSGRGQADVLPPVTVRLEFPAQWRVLLIRDGQGGGLHGAGETKAFDELPHFPAEQAARLCRLVLMQLLPALAERDHKRFGEAIGELQRVVGDHFAPAQGGRFTSQRVTEVLKWLNDQGIAGVGQSSWGPTGFAIIENAHRAESLARALKTRFAGRELWFQVIQARNHGADIALQDCASGVPGGTFGA